jgi:hypothetical protein
MPNSVLCGRPTQSYWHGATKIVGAALFVGCLTSPLRAVDIDGEPIYYTSAPANNAVSRMQARIEAGQVMLAFDDRFGYLRALLRELNVPVSSQMLVFSKTSLQHHRISPQRPRAIFFNDEAYVGFCQHGDVLEISAVDPGLGMVFYTLDQKGPAKPRFTRQQDTCLICHGSSANEGLPGNIVRSVYPDAEGYGILSSGSFRVDQSTPLKQRWGGWYVTGTSGKQRHLGNLILQEKRRPEEIDNLAGVNVTDLKGRFRTAAYLSPHSDIVALMVLEHQAEMHNRITRANLLTRKALFDEAEMNKALGRPVDYRSESTSSRIKNAGEPLVKYMLFSGEAKLTDRVHGTSAFAEEFVQRGPRDSRGRSLRDLNLQQRLFAYPCSYLIYSAVFEALPVQVKDYVMQRLWAVLTGKDSSEDFAHLSQVDRRAILEILLATKPNRPGYWKLPSAQQGP